MKVLLLVSTLITLALLVLSVSKARGIPESISSSYYQMGKSGWIFQLLMMAMAVSLYFTWIGLSGEIHEWMVFISCSSLLFVSLSPCFREHLQGKVHYTFAVIGCACTILWQILEGLWDIVIYFAWIGGSLSLLWRKQWCWLIESSIIASLLANLWRII